METLEERKERIKKEILKNRDENLLKRFKDMEPFKNEDCVPELPIINDEDIRKEITDIFIKCGAIPKKDLIKGKSYIGQCRNASIATWTGEDFVYKRNKFGCVFDEHINHFEIEGFDDGSDVFIPIKENT